MQVTHIEEHKSHVVVGGRDVIAFGMADTSEFFELLSNSLYSDKKLAVIREVLCNAWDAHISGSVQHIPVKITLTESSLTIKDFGPGIHHAVIGPIYCVYGNSTKGHDGKVNGGFGLGSKAPFAYTDHFTVESCHQGIKYVYAVSRGSKETDGKPDFRTVVGNIPTQESGLTVTIPLQNPRHRGEFIAIIKRIAYFGDMNVELNEVDLPRLPMDSCTDGVMLVNTSLSQEAANLAYDGDKVWVRYGTVVYPIPAEHSYAKMYDRVQRIAGDHGVIIFQAPPNMISVTPSRESLSMTDRTKQTLCEMLARFISNIEEVNRTHAFADACDLAARFVSQPDKPPSFWFEMLKRSSLKAINGFTDTLGEYHNGFYEIMRMMLIRNDHSSSTGRWKSYLTMLEAMQLHEQRYIKEIRLMRKFYEKDKRISYVYDALQGIVNRYRIEVFKKALSPEDRDTIRIIHDVNPSGRVKFETLNMLALNRLNGIIETNSIIIGKNQDGILTEARNLKLSGSVICIYQPLRKGQVERIMKTLEDAGYNVIDAMGHIIYRPAKIYEPVKKEKGYPLLADCLHSNGYFIAERMYREGIPRILKPTIVFHVENQRGGNKVVGGWGYNPLHDVIKFIPDAVIVPTEKRAEILIEKEKAVPGIDKLAEIMNQMIDDPTSKFIEYLGHQTAKYSGKVATLMEIGKCNFEIAKLLGMKLVNNPTFEAASNLLHMMSYYSMDRKIRAISDKATEKVEAFHQTSTLIQKVEENSLLGFLNLGEIRSTIVNKKPEAKEAVKLLTQALKG